MRNNPIAFILVFSAIILAIDFYSYRGVKKLTANYGQNIRRIVWLLFWIVPFLLISGLILFSALNIRPANFLSYFHLISGTFMLFYVPKLVFIIFNLIDDLYLSIKRILKRIEVKRQKDERLRSATKRRGRPISRAQFLSRVGILVSGIPFLSIAYGIKWGRYNFKIREHTLTFANLPASFDGLRIVQFSDFHIGSFMTDWEKVTEAVEIINDQNADLLLFTGDFVNNVSSEMDNFLPMLNRLNAKLGKYSILGNHDYGDYVSWKSAEEKRENLNRLVRIQEDMGIKMLLNGSQRIALNGDAIELIGVENWGLPPFPQYGNLDKALENVNPYSFKILMSHDPSHWDEEVLRKTDIDLTLSGHTHGAQFGIEIPGLRWSPASMRYKRWGGMYRVGEQHLHVNTGIGFIGFPGRVGMPPEITVIELKRAV